MSHRSDVGWIDKAEYPFVSHYLATPAGRLHYVDEGQGSVIVMIHGNPTWSFMYRKLIKQLRPYHRCVAMDHLGFGLSDKPGDWSYTPEDHTANLSALIEHLKLDGITLMVQDWGGPLGLAYATQHPEKIARIIIMNTWAWPVNHDPHYIAFSSFMGGPIGRMLIRRYNFFTKTLMRQIYGDKEKLTDSIHSHYLQALASPDERKGCYVFPRQILQSTNWLTQVWHDISKLKDKPVLIAWGMKDVAFREKELKKWEKTFPSALSIRLDSVGHFVPEEAPDELYDVIATVLQDNPPSPASSRIDVYPSRKTVINK